MANTKIPVELSSTPSIVDGGNATAITIDSSENVGIGTSPTLGAFHVKSAVSDMVTFEQTDAGTVGSKLQLYHNSSSPADGDIISLLTFQGNDDAGNHTSYGGIRGLAADVSNGSEDGTLTFSTTREGSFTEAMRIDSSGNVGIGTTSPASLFHMQDDSSGAYVSHIVDNTNAGGYANTVYRCGTAYAGINYAPGIFFAIGPHTNDTSTPITFRNSSATERMRIDTSGTLFIGKTSSAFATAGIELYGTGRAFITHANDDVLLLNRTGSAGKILKFYDDGSEVGSISTNTNSLPSDKNFKKNINNLDLGLNLIKKLKPSQYNYKHNNDNTPLMYGLIAQDLEESLAEVGVEKNSTWLLQHNPTEDEKQSDYDLDYGKLTPILIKAIQEQQTLIETQQTTINDLKSRIETLEG